MAYTIEVNYQTGGSFRTEECTDTIGLAWESLDLVKAALKTIKEHYEFYKEFDSYSFFYKENRSEAAILKDVDAKPWQRVAIKDKYDVQASAEMDNGEWRNIPTSMWCGYFETLYSARVVLTEGSDDMMVNFD